MSLGTTPWIPSTPYNWNRYFGNREIVIREKMYAELIMINEKGKRNLLRESKKFNHSRLHNSQLLSGNLTMWCIDLWLFCMGLHPCREIFPSWGKEGWRVDDLISHCFPIAERTRISTTIQHQRENLIEDQTPCMSQIGIIYLKEERTYASSNTP